MSQSKANPEAISTQIKLTSWNILNPSEQSMLKGLGFSPKQLPKKPTTVRTSKACRSLKEYYLVAAVSCRLCNNTTIESYKMTQQNYSPQSPGEPYLKAIPAQYEEAIANKARLENHTRPVCVACKERLQEKTKEELITLLIGFAKYDMLRR